MINQRFEQIANQTGVVVIGRNEGQRLMACLASLKKHTDSIVYVDSGSTDGSAQAAAALGVEVVNLDLSKSFTAARARNAGFSRLADIYPNFTYVQFVDGDCEVDVNWIATAYDFLERNPHVAIACGRRRERYPERSIYNYQCDIEWNTPVGEAKACGGDCLVRRSAFEAVAGFSDRLIAGEEPELCLRMRRLGWKIWRLDAEMTLHDAAIYQFSQWWKRSVRAGHAFAEGAYMYGFAPERHWLKETLRAVAWGLFLPLLILGMSFAGLGYSVIFAMLYLLQYFRMLKKYEQIAHKWKYSLLMLLSKFAEMCGIFSFYRNLILKRRGRLIEYK